MSSDFQDVPTSDRTRVDAVVAAVVAADRAGVPRWIRVGLFMSAGFILALAVPSLLEHGENGHASRHVGAFAVSYAVAVLVVAVRPARSRTVLPAAVVLAGALVITAVIDLSRGVIPLVDESLHLPELASAGLLWLTVRASRPRPAGYGRPRHLSDVTRSGNSVGTSDDL
jgi:hypothetical protein